LRCGKLSIRIIKLRSEFACRTNFIAATAYEIEWGNRRATALHLNWAMRGIVPTPDIQFDSGFLAIVGRWRHHRLHGQGAMPCSPGTRWNGVIAEPPPAPESGRCRASPLADTEHFS